MKNDDIKRIADALEYIANKLKDNARGADALERIASILEDNEPGSLLDHINNNGKMIENLDATINSGFSFLESAIADGFTNIDYTLKKVVGDQE